MELLCTLIPFICNSFGDEWIEWDLGQHEKTVYGDLIEYAIRRRQWQSSISSFDLASRNQ